ncbi:CobW/HypB/UreG, nucleotide-binding domain containing protein [Novymonas esmeraldas]|uniref:CobW/HypB/UreG, nucleotide-binding domain containing protein n=1 Tax=Novymonas esmeraldas TaxID=1808958 RepID=A0AAW0ER81_9TRYP
MSGNDEDECPELISARVPVTVLTGFLGSGKTTLLHYILSANHDMRIAVIVNEFEFGKTIEKGLTLKSSEKPDDEWLELNNGCMCCTAQTQTVKALESLMQRKGTFDLILVETSGLADPGPIASMFWQDAALCGALYLSGIVTLVDSVNICKYLKDDDVSQEAVRQILIADKVVLNKCDIASAAQQAAALAAVQAINPVAAVINSDHSRVPNLREILLIDTTRTAPELEHLHEHHQSSITAVSLEFADAEQGLAVGSQRDVDAICTDLLYRSEECGFEVVRCKAAIWRYESGQYSLLQLQSIGELFDVTPMEGQSVPFCCTRALVLGKRLDEAKLRAVFAKYLKPTKAAARD